MERKETDFLLFDLDGTLVDSSRDIAEAANRTLAALGRATESEPYIKDRIGWGVKMLLEQLMPDATPDQIEDGRVRFLDFYALRLTDHTDTYPKVRETLDGFHLQGKRMAVVSNKPEGLSVRIIEELGLGRYFEMVVGGDTYTNKKPHPEPIRKVLEAMGAAPERSVFVGDSPVDCESGREAGLFTVGVTYGFRDVEELEKAGFDLIIDDFSHLLKVLR